MRMLDEGDGGLRDGGVFGGEARPLGDGINDLVDDEFGTLDIHFIGDFK